MAGAYMIALLIVIVVAQGAALVVLARARASALRQVEEQATSQVECRAVVHDLNNVLSVILNYATFVLEDLPVDDPSREDVAEIRRAALSAGFLTHSLGGRQGPPDVPERVGRAPGKRRAAA
jgi:light-regulated signal transduction histidine kinase (bacteriophytochrome)